jgi:methylthioribose-1-phosphate isomerase
MPEDRSPEASRRQFFRVLSQQTVVSAGSLMGAVNELRQTGASAANQLLGLSLPPDEATPTTVEAAFRSPYRLNGNVLLIPDQRGLPDMATVVECRTADAVAAALRTGVAGSGPVLGQIAAYALLLAVAGRADRPAPTRRAALRLAASTLRAARFNQRAVRAALARVEAIDAALPDDVPADDHVAALRAEAERIATDAAIDHSRLGKVGAELLMDVLDNGGREPAGLALLVHGDGGAMAGGMIGTSFAALNALVAAERPVHAWLTEGAPTMEGARLGAWQLAANDVPHTIVADTAVGWLLGARRMDAVLLRADWVCANGDIAAPIGSLSVARLAADAGVAVYACAPLSVIDPATDSLAAIPVELRAPVEGRPGPRLDPAADLLPAKLLTAFITSAGVRAPTDVAREAVS